MPSSSESCMNDDSKGFNEEQTSSDGYGGYDPNLYDAIVTFKNQGTYPDFCNLKENRNAHYHWRNRCKKFTLTDSGILLYSSNNPSTARAVVRVGEVRLVIRFIHEKIGHGGARHTNAICARRLYWRSMHRDIYRYVAGCEFCTKRRNIKKTDPQLIQIDSPPTVNCSSQDENAEMRMITERLLLNTDDDLGGELQEYYREAEEVEQQMMHPVYEEMDGGQFYVLERDVADTLSNMNGAYLVALDDDPIKIEPVSHSSSSIVYDEVEEEEEEVEEGSEQTMPMIVSDDAIPAVSDETVTAVSPLGVDQSIPSPSEEEGLRMEKKEDNMMEEREVEEVEKVKMIEQRIEEDRRRAGNVRKRRLVMGPSSMHYRAYPLNMRAGTSNSTKKSLLEENQALRSRLSHLEAIISEERASMVMQMPPIDSETAEMQRSLLHLQREVLIMQRTYWQSKLHREGFDVQIGDYYDQSAEGEVMEEGEDGEEESMQHHQLHHHYEEEEVGDDEELDENRVIGDHIIDNVH